MSNKFTKYSDTVFLGRDFCTKFRENIFEICEHSRILSIDEIVFYFKLGVPGFKNKITKLSVLIKPINVLKHLNY